MSSRRLALMGAPSGPWVYTVAIHNPRVKIRGLEGSTLTVTQRFDPTTEKVLLLHEDGAHDVPEAPWMRMTCHPPVASICVEILSGATDAVQST